MSNDPATLVSCFNCNASNWPDDQFCHSCNVELWDETRKKQEADMKEYFEKEARKYQDEQT